jgi:hypothetical protein
MLTYKYIHWRDDMPKNEQGERFANIHLLKGNCEVSVKDFCKMAEEVRETFPQATNDEVFCGKVISSTFVQGFFMAIFNEYIPEGDYPDWIQTKSGRAEYTW